MNLVCDPQFVLHGLQGILLDGVSASLDGRLAAVVLCSVRITSQVDDLQIQSQMLEDFFNLGNFKLIFLYSLIAKLFLITALLCRID